MPPTPAFALHRAAARLVRAYAAARIPLPRTPAGGDLGAGGLAGRLASLRAPDQDAAFARLRSLQARLDFLKATDPRTRAALARWAALEERWEGAVGRGADPCAQAGAFAAGAALLPRVARPPALKADDGGAGAGGAGDAPTAGVWGATSSSGGGDGGGPTPSDDEDEAGHASAAAAADAALDALTAEAITAGPPGSLEDGARPAAARAASLAAALAGAGLRASPVEWLYCGLAPLLPGPVAAARRGAPLGVAAVAAGVAARLGLPCVPAGLVAGAENGEATTARAALAASLPPDRAARLVGRASSLASAPPGAGDAWVLVCPDGGWAWDPSSGRVVEVERGGGGDEAGLPALAAAAAGLGENASIHLATGARRSWAALLRTAVIAHTRRGDAEAVAGVLPQLLAVDGGAEEWAMMGL